MEHSVVKKDHFIEPGYVYMPASPTRLCAVVASGVGITMYDRRRRIGGMAHYIRPYRQKNLSTAAFAAPAITALSRFFLDTGSVAADLETHFYGGAVNPDAEGFEPGVSEDNGRIGIEVLEKLGIPLTGKDVGGERARKLVFHSGTGEIMMAKVEAVRATDWYPAVK